MKYKFTVFFLVLALALTGCKNISNQICPFSNANWNCSPSDIIKLEEGTAEQIYSSVYGGKTYVWSHKYNEISGTIKYMFDNKDQLACISWSTSCDSQTSLKKLYNSLNQELTRQTGNSGYSTNGTGNYGSVWYLDSGNIILSAVSTDTQQALQYSYISPSHSEDPPKN